MDRIPKEGNKLEQSRNCEFYYMLMEACQHGNAENIIDEVDNKCGSTAWNKLTK